MYERIGSHRVDQRRLEQDLVEFGEVDPLRVLGPFDDDVGRLSEEARPDDGEGDADDREQQHRRDAQPLRAHPLQESSDRRAEVLRALDRHADAESHGAVDRGALPGGRDLVVVVRPALAVRSVGGHAVSMWHSLLAGIPGSLTLMLPRRRRTATRRSPGTWRRCRAGRDGCRGRRCVLLRARRSGRRSRSSTPVGRRSPSPRPR